MDIPAVNRTARHDYYGGHHHDDDGHYSSRNFSCHRTDASGTLGGVSPGPARIRLLLLAQTAFGV